MKIYSDVNKHDSTWWVKTIPWNFLARRFVALNDCRPARAIQSVGLEQVKIIMLNRYHFPKVILVDKITFLCVGSFFVMGILYNSPFSDLAPYCS